MFACVFVSVMGLVETNGAKTVKFCTQVRLIPGYDVIYISRLFSKIEGHC